MIISIVKLSLILSRCSIYLFSFFNIHTYQRIKIYLKFNNFNIYFFRMCFCNDIDYILRARIRSTNKVNDEKKKQKWKLNTRVRCCDRFCSRFIYLFLLRFISVNSMKLKNPFWLKKFQTYSHSIAIFGYLIGFYGNCRST